MEAKILHMSVILQHKLDKSNALCYFYNFEPFWVS